MQSKIEAKRKPLHFYLEAASKGDISTLVPFLHVHPEDKRVNLVNEEEGMNALMLAIVNKQLDVFNILIRLPSFNLLAKDKNDNNAIHWAARFGLNEYIFALIACGLPLKEINGDGFTAEDLAIIHGFPDTAKIIMYTRKKENYSYSRSLQGWINFVSELSGNKNLPIDGILPTYPTAGQISKGVGITVPDMSNLVVHEPSISKKLGMPPKSSEEQNFAASRVSVTNTSTAFFSTSTTNDASHVPEKRIRPIEAVRVYNPSHACSLS